MSSCCLSAGTGEPGSCPICGVGGIPVSRSALERLLPPERRGQVIDVPYFFCATPECDIAYFADAPLHYFATEDLAMRPGFKEAGEPTRDDHAIVAQEE